MALQEVVTALVAQARVVGMDTVAVEIKKAAGGAPKTLPETVSAFTNGGGGVIILGLDEADGFQVVPIDAHALAESLQSACSDRVEPAVRATVEIVQIDGRPVVAASIPVSSLESRPCYVKSQGMERGSYIRAHDGDRHLTSYEIHLMVSGRGQPQDDAQPVAGATVADLNQAEVDKLVQRFQRTRGPAFAHATSAEVLRWTGVCPRGEDSDRVTLAGLMALGTYPQEFFPQLNVTFVSYPTLDGRPMADGTRFLDNVSIDGPIPMMVSGLVDAVTRSMTRRAVMVGIGREDVWEYPLEAVRELTVNALMHRDYHPLAWGSQVRVEMFPDRLVFLNPGGLYGTANVSDLLEGRASSSRNAVLCRLLEDIQMPGTYRTVCENRGTGLPMVSRELKNAGLPGPAFKPTASIFVAELSNTPVPKQPSQAIPASSHDAVDAVDALIVSTLLSEPKTNVDLQHATGLGRAAVSRRLMRLEKGGLVAPTASRRSPNVKWQLVRRDVAPVTSTEVIDAFQGFINDRAASNVLVAKAVTDISFRDRVVTVTFDPSSVGLSLEAFNELNAFSLSREPVLGLAAFAGSFIGFKNDVGKRLRPAIDAVTAVLPDGTSLGSATTRDLFQMATGDSPHRH